jgi:hypothetical protein
MNNLHTQVPHNSVRWTPSRASLKRFILYGVVISHIVAVTGVPRLQSVVSTRSVQGQPIPCNGVCGCCVQHTIASCCCRRTPPNQRPTPSKIHPQATHSSIYRKTWLAVWQIRKCQGHPDNINPLIFAIAFADMPEAWHNDVMPHGWIVLSDFWYDPCTYAPPTPPPRSCSAESV